MNRISVSELKADTDKYVSFAQETDIHITENGKVVAKLVAAKPDKKEAFARFLSLFPKDGLNVDSAAAREERRTI